MADRFSFRVWDNEAEQFCSNTTIDALALMLHPTGVITFQCGENRFPSAMFEPVFEDVSISKSPPQPPETARPGDNTGKDGAE